MTGEERGKDELKGHTDPDDWVRVQCSQDSWHGTDKVRVGGGRKQTLPFCLAEYTLLHPHLVPETSPGYSCLENPMDTGACWATVHGLTKGWTLLSN